MNVYQRIILVLGVIAIVAVIVIAEKNKDEGYLILRGRWDEAGGEASGGYRLTLETPLRLVGVMAVTALMWLALGSTGPASTVNMTKLRRGLNRIFFLAGCGTGVMLFLVASSNDPDLSLSNPSFLTHLGLAVIALLICIPILIYYLLRGIMALVVWVARGFTP